LFGQTWLDRLNSRLLWEVGQGVAEQGDVEGWILAPNDPVQLNSEESFFTTEQMSRACVLNLVGFARLIATVAQSWCYHFKESARTKGLLQAGELIPGDSSKALRPEQLVCATGCS
jgi:hypothetical protein